MFLTCRELTKKSTLKMKLKIQIKRF